MNYCVNSNELEKLLDLRLKNEAIEDVILKSLLDNAVQWQEKFLCMTFSLARILERRRDSSSLTMAMIPEFFSMPENMFIDIQECDEDFVNYMLEYEHSGDIDLETSLQTVARKLSEHSYGKKTLRD
ncbi:MAG: hypothetical protein Q3M30_18070 [Candidatus Electrothrix sp. Rat3]|nr:hypothetical protein [Candidatus Electrothrix rattekaaiensis]